MTNDDEWFDDFSEMDFLEKNIENISDHISELLSWDEFASKCLVEMQHLDRRLSSIEIIAKSCVGGNVDVDNVFGLGVCWIGAVAAYEGHLHGLFLNALSVNSLQSRISEFCQRRIDEKFPPGRGMKDASLQSVRQWLTARTITDPRTMIKNFEEIFGIKIESPENSFSDHLLEIRNAFAHRGGGGHSLSIPDVMSMTETLSHLANSFTHSLISQVENLLKKEF
jgi:hypothetical protein